VLTSKNNSCGPHFRDLATPGARLTRVRPLRPAGGFRDGAPDSAGHLALWACIALFFARVAGQLEVLLLAPDWLPAMPAWYSGLLPYPVLLPLQITLLMLMSVMAYRTRMVGRTARPLRRRTARLLRLGAGVYFVIMALRLGWVIRLFGADFYRHGAIPVAFHWVLALFVLIWARARGRCPAG
jgi:hypothetical protein